MHLWTEYEGRTIAGTYTLNKLLRSEGRNGFFSTSDGAGHSAVIRLTEAHFDEDEQLRRWNQVAGVHQGNLIEIEKVGKTTLEGVPLTYALMEPDDANLGDVLKERPLTVAETSQVARSVTAALLALHGNGLVHEHVEPANVLAVGETVKLRSDCVRECVADPEFNTPEGCAELRRRDVRDLGTLLLQCLTLDREWNPSANFPETFRRVIPRALDGSWSLEQIAAFLDPIAFAPSPEAKAAPASATTAPAAPESAQAAANKRAPVVQGQAASDLARVFRPGSLPLHARRHAPAPEPSALPTGTIWAVCVVSAVVLALLLWHFGRSRPAGPAAFVQSPLTAARPAATPLTHAASTASQAAPAMAAPLQAGWYVIAYTYNHRGQAQARANRLAAHHQGLQPEVFSPSGHAPYLVALGGPVSEVDAAAILRRARRSGIPRDTFIRRY